MDVILTYTMVEGALRFAELPRRVGWDDLLDHMALLPGLALVETFPAVAGGWAHFRYGGGDFTVRDAEDGTDYWLLARDADCPERLMMDVAVHCATVLGSRWEHN